MLTNQLATALSPYLLQHKTNPVAWQEWSEASLDLARRYDRPVLLSIGYAACHWCHVMAHESFESPAIADLMNANFINIKVDREERPDVDHIYMSALHALGEQGGWPLTMFLTPDGQPFWGGTYFPPEPRYGRPGFPQILREIARLWRDDRSRILKTAGQLSNHLMTSGEVNPTPKPAVLDHTSAPATLVQAVDMERGGLRGAPKFPQAPVFAYLQLVGHRTHNQPAIAAVQRTLDGMLMGGIYDQLGGGLCRYSTDADWHVPHFEKMLYDNAQLISMLAHEVIHAPNPFYERRITETIAFLDRDLKTPEGLFASSLDADQEGEEGRFYTWDLQDLAALLDKPTLQRFAAAFHVLPTGNWEHTNVLTLGSIADPEAILADLLIAAARATLLEQRATRTPPPRDDKILADWNALAITALVDAGLALNRPDWVDSAETTATKLLDLLWVKGRLHHAGRNRLVGPIATANDYAYLIQSLLKLQGATGDAGWTTQALALLTALDQHHFDRATGLYRLSAEGDGTLLFRPTLVHDDVTPAANAVMIECLIWLAKLTDQPDLLTRATALHAAIAARDPENPFATPSFLRASLLLEDPVELTAVNQPPPDLIRSALATTGLSVSFVHQNQANMPPSLLICRKQVCANPAQDKNGLNAALNLLGFT